MTVKEYINTQFSDYTFTIDPDGKGLTFKYTGEHNNQNKENNEMTKTVKNVLFLAPGYQYAKTVVANQSKELDRKKIPYNASTEPKNFYIRTDKVNVEIVYMDPVKWTPELFHKRDAVFGKKELVNKAHDTFHSYFIRRPDTSLSKYIREAYTNDTHKEVKPRNTYLPEITHAYFNNPVTVVLWDDGTKTVVKCQEGDVYSPETGLALCVTKKAFGNMPNFNNIFRKWIPEETEEVSVAGVTFNEYVDEMNKTLCDRFKEIFGIKE